MHVKLIPAVLLIAVLSACSLPGQSAPPSEAPPVEPAQTDPLAATPGASPKSIGTPVPGWENIPIMPGAYNGELEDLVYLYSVKESLERVEEFYLTKMDVNGWALSSRQTMETGPSTVLEFQKNDRVLTVMLVHVPEEDSTAVILSQLGP